MTWLFLGDSFTVGMAAKLTALFLAAGDNTIVEGHVGWSTASWLTSDRAASEIHEQHPDIIVFALGTNDAADRNVLQERVEHLLTEAHGAVVFWIGPFGPNDSERGEWIKEVVGEEWYIDGLTFCGDLRHNNELHLDTAGYGTLADRLVNELLGRVDSYD